MTIKPSTILALTISLAVALGCFASPPAPYLTSTPIPTDIPAPTPTPTPALGTLETISEVRETLGCPDCDVVMPIHGKNPSIKEFLQTPESSRRNNSLILAGCSYGDGIQGSPSIRVLLPPDNQGKTVSQSSAILVESGEPLPAGKCYAFLTKYKGIYHVEYHARSWGGKRENLLHFGRPTERVEISRALVVILTAR